MILIYHRFRAGIFCLENNKSFENGSKTHALAGGDTFLYHHYQHLSFLFRGKVGMTVSLGCFTAAHKNAL